jgi:hypothetical protein
MEKSQITLHHKFLIENMVKGNFFSFKAFSMLPWTESLIIIRKFNEKSVINYCFG